VSNELIDLVLQEAEEKMDGAVSHARQEFANVRTGRASSGLVERISVDAYGVEMKARELASFSVPEARQLVITPHDPQNIGAIERAIQLADLGLNPSNDGRSIRLNFPPLTTERRRELVKLVNTMAEDGKNRIRGLRRSARKDLEDLEKEGGVSSDDIDRAQADLDKLTQQHEALVEKARTEKEKELLADD
jgi:ribosome recycling factor